MEVIPAVADTLDLSNKKLKKLNKFTPQETQISVLILDDNELQRLDNIDAFTKLQKLSAVRNQLLRMYGVCRLHSLQHLNLSNNGILTIEGLKDLVNLKWLCLAGNSIKTIEHLNTNINLEYLDLSTNNITHVSDLSFLKNLKVCGVRSTHKVEGLAQELYLHNNRINHLRQCERFLPTSLITLTLTNNNIEDLNEISQLVHLINLNNISISNNPCVAMASNAIGFDYRPFVINWLLNVKTIDGYVVDAIESLRAEWLYSQGRGRHFRVGDQKDLVQYLSGVCPLTGETLETEEDRKLRLILSKAQHHQQQLRDQQSNAGTPNPSPLTKKKVQKNSPRLNTSRISNKSQTKSPDRIMTTSCYDNNTISNLDNNSTIMTQSLDPSIFRQTTKLSSTEDNKLIDDSFETVNSPLQALSKMVPVPESLMSPDYRPSSIIINNSIGRNKINSTKILQSTTNNIRSSPKSSRNNTNIVTKNKCLNSDLMLRKSNSPSPSRQRKFNNNNTSNNNHNNNKENTKNSILRKSTSSDDESEVCISKLQTIQLKAEERRLQSKDCTDIVYNNSSNSNNSDDKLIQQAAVCIQKVWRGYYTRNCNKEIQDMFRTLQAQRAGQYIQQLTNDMQTTKAALESERKIQMLQTEAISALWKQMSALQPNNSNQNNVNMTDLSTDNAEIVKELSRTCTVLQTQIQQLQCSMHDIAQAMTVFSQHTGLHTNFMKENGIATQTEIVAVHTPQGEAGKVFPFQKQTTRPSSLPLPITQRKKDGLQQHNQQQQTQQQQNVIIHNELRQYAGSLVEGAIKTVSETKADCLGYDTTEITVTDTSHLDNSEKTDNVTEKVDVGN